MPHSPLLPVLAAGLATLGISQTLAPTVHAETVLAETVLAVPALRVSVQSLHVKQTPGGVEVTGRIVNTGQRALSYPAVACVFTDAAGAEVQHADGYLTAGPVAPGQAASFRAMSPASPHFAQITLRLREAGRTVTVQPLAPLAAGHLSAHLSASRRTTVW
jgi:hypothetical protein